jgi:hypothetical protein
VRIDAARILLLAVPDQATVRLSVARARSLNPAVSVISRAFRRADVLSIEWTTCSRKPIASRCISNIRESPNRAGWLAAIKRRPRAGTAGAVAAKALTVLQDTGKSTT